MPYVRCRRCELVSFSAAYLATVDRCSRCGAELPRPTVAFTRGRLRPSSPAGRPASVPQPGSGRG